MRDHPLIDSHVDLPFVVRSMGERPLRNILSSNGSFPGHFDVLRMREGHVGGVFMVAWTPCAAWMGEDDGPDFLSPTNAVRDTIEGLDIIQEMVKSLPEHLRIARTSADIREAFQDGKIATLMAIEGAHQLGNSLSTLRLYAQIGVKYLTLTHTCHNAFASSAGSGVPLVPAHPEGGLTELGRSLIGELNRLGMMVDLSHVSDQTARDVRSFQAPVIFSHSGARAIHDHPRNIPDDILRLIGTGEGRNPGIILSVFYPSFIDPLNPTVERVADHIEYIASICGRAHVGIGSDFDGMASSVEGLEDASKYPNLIAVLIRRGWTDEEVIGVMGGNLMRVMDAVDANMESLDTALPSDAVYEKRQDLPAKWGGPDGAYLPAGVSRYLQRSHLHDEL
ncbi:membrane dipeptidase, partial [Tremellales sp. Uapishka_1]